MADEKDVARQAPKAGGDMEPGDNTPAPQKKPEPKEKSKS